MGFKTVDEVIDFAIRKEDDAAKMYTELADRVEYEYMSRLLLEFAREEKGHKAKLLAIKEGKYLVPATEKIMTLGIADNAVAIEPGPDMDFQDALLLAMKEEKAAFAMYTKLAESTDDPDLKSTLLALAQEEAKHKLRFELEYDEHVLTEG
ncbi:MAG: ferritin family protein [Candidatus Hydrogenedentes bacterium]|nr:ferritin family protein [Candidatus Hydrogenedentota bacterium]